MTEDDSRYFTRHDVVDGCAFTAFFQAFGSTDIADVIKIITVAFRGANPTSEFCQACERPLKTRCFRADNP